MIRTFISSPYSGNVDRNLAYARLCCRDSFDRMEAPFASHLLYTQPLILDDTIPIERFRGTQAAFEWLSAADLVAFYTDYGWTPGMQKELDMAHVFRRRTEIRQILQHDTQQIENLNEDPARPHPR